MARIYIVLLILVFGCKKLVNQSQTEEDGLQYKTIVNKDSILIDRSDFEQVVHKVIALYNQKEKSKLNQLINQETGLYYILRLGTIDARFKKDRICFNNCDEKDRLDSPFSEITREQQLDSTYTIKYESYPEFSFEDCEKTTKEGLFVDTLKVDHLLSNTIKHYKTVFLEEELSVSYTELDKEIEGVLELENNSRKIMLTKNNSNFYSGHFIFYLTKIDNKWWLTIIDFVTMDCSV